MKVTIDNGDRTVILAFEDHVYKYDTDSPDITLTIVDAVGRHKPMMLSHWNREADVNMLIASARSLAYEARIPMNRS